MATKSRKMRSKNLLAVLAACSASKLPRRLFSCWLSQNQMHCKCRGTSKCNLHFTQGKLKVVNTVVLQSRCQSRMEHYRKFFFHKSGKHYILDLNFSASNCHELLFKLRIHLQPGSYCGPVFVYMTDSMKFHTSTNNHTGIQVHPASSCTKRHKLIPVRLSYRYEFHTGTTFIWYEILGGDYMIPVRLSYRYEFNPVLIVAMFFFT